MRNARYYNLITTKRNGEKMDKNRSVYSGLKLFHHMDRINDLINGKRTMPVYVRIKPTNMCNQKCYYCVYADDSVFDTRKVEKRDSIPWEKMKEIIEDLSEGGVKAITFSGGGEPLCYPYILPALRLVQKSGIDYSVITNAQALEGQVVEELINAKWIRVSLDSSDGSTYEKIRGVKTFDKVISNIENFAGKKCKDCELGINYVVTNDNYNQIYDICRIASGIGVNNIKFAPIMVKDFTAKYHQNIAPIVEEQIVHAKENFERNDFKIIDKYSNDIGLDEEFQKQYCICFMKEIFTVIAADSKVYYCHQKAYTPEGLIGDISGQSFNSLWFSEETTEKFRKMRADTECNFRCVFEERNQLLNDFIFMDQRHLNFI